MRRIAILQNAVYELLAMVALDWEDRLKFILQHTRLSQVKPASKWRFNARAEEKPHILSERSDQSNNAVLVSVVASMPGKLELFRYVKEQQCRKGGSIHTTWLCFL